MASLGKGCAPHVCSTCKLRKKGCDKQLPSCGYCTKRKLGCRYDDPYPDRSRGGDSDGGGGSSSSTELTLPPDKPGSPALTKSLGHYDLEDIILVCTFGLHSVSWPGTTSTRPKIFVGLVSRQLKSTASYRYYEILVSTHELIVGNLQWQQFATETAATMTGAWEKELLSLAFSSDYLMHGFLSTAALHLAFLNPGQRDKYEYLSAQHQHVAIGPYRRAMSVMTSENCDQVFAFSLLMIIAQFAPSRSLDSMSPYSDVSLYKGPANWMECLRGSGSILHQARSHLPFGPFGNLFAQGIQLHSLVEGTKLFPPNEDDQSIENCSRHLLKLQCVKDSTTVAEMEAYTESISLLRKLLAVSSTASDPLTSQILSSYWPVKIPTTFIRMLYEERPPALIITAHYCLLLKRCCSCWFVEHRAYVLLKAVEQSLADEWDPFLEHPLRVIGNS